MSDLRLYFFIVLVGVGFEVHALPDPLPECDAEWLFHGRNFERGDDPEESLLEAQQAFDDYAHQMSRVDVDELDLGFFHDRFDSATRLAGPEDSGAGYLRISLENAVSRHSENVWPESVLGRPCRLVDTVVHFPDGTMVTLEAENAQIDFHSRKFIGFDYRVNEASVTDLNDWHAPGAHGSDAPAGGDAADNEPRPRR